MKPRQRLPLIVTALVLVVGWALVSGVALPHWRRLRTLRDEAAIAERKLAKLERLAQRKPQIEANYAAAEPLRSTEPDAQLQRIFLDELEQLAGSSNLQLNLKPKSVQQDKDKRISRVAVEMDVDASQEALFEFLDRLLAWPRLIELERLRIGASPSREFPLRASIVVHKLAIRFSPADAGGIEKP